MVIQANQKESSDQNEFTKAAAWAWYERGSWFEQNTIRETDLIRRPRDDHKPRPSRYKVEAMKEARSCNISNVSKPLLCTTERVDNYSLFDTYEIERISRELCCYVESSRIDGGDHGRRSNVSNEAKGGRKTAGKKNNWGWRPQGIMCRSSREDVIENTVLVGERRRRKTDTSMVRVKNSGRVTIHN
ncbi:hypothetical protein SSX86_010574 [Deinandra increscens subsp. villosa]|uniref:Uncharacterized protein n=1 Tax=Deinandra increscens subsp. villosa TaxID=3103831 RepID=A0AAP0D888_9ASTR